MHRRTWRLLFLAETEYRATGKRSSGQKRQEMPTQALTCHRSGVGWLALVRQARGVRKRR
jgi:hypothetical protein